jgi:hypothetical protein
MSDTSSVEQLAALVGTALKPLLDPLSSTNPNGAGLKAFVGQLGWTLPDPVPSSLIALQTGVIGVLKDVETLVQLQAAGDNGGTVDETALAQAFVTLAEDIVTLTQALSQLGPQLQTQLPAAYLSATGIEQNLVPRLFDYLIINALLDGSPVAARVLRLLGIIEITEEDANAAIFQPAYTLHKVHWERISQWFQKPQQVFADVYGWGTNTLNMDPLFDALQSLSYAINSPGAYDYPSTGLLNVVAPGVSLAGKRIERIFEMPLVDLTAAQLTFAITPIPTASTTEPQGLAFVVAASGSIASLTIPLTDHLSILFDGTLDATAGIGLTLRPGQDPKVFADVEATGSPLTNGDLTAKVQYAVADSEPPSTLLDVGDGSGITLRGAYFGGGISASTGQPFDVQITGGLRKGQLTIATSGADSFLSVILPSGGIKVSFDFSLIWSSLTGVHFDGGATLETALAVNVAIGPFEVDTIHVLLALAGGDLQIALTVTGTGELGPIKASVDRIGIKSTLAFHSGNLGPVDVGFGFQPPAGLGIAIDAGPISGGGYILFDPTNGRYAGILSLSLYGLSITAIGLLDTKLPGGQSGYSFLIIISVQFDVGIQLGFGFTLTGVGGLCGINRSMLTDAIQTGLRKHALDAILFPPDPIGNAPQIISELSTIYPPALGRYVFGPMLQLAWGTPTLIQAELGFIIEVPSPIVIAILGQLAMRLPAPDAPIVLIQIDILGVIDFGQQLFSIDASLHDSRIVDFTLTGDMAFRLNWGSNPNFVFSVGGFNPHYTPPPSFPTLQRLTLALNEGPMRLTLQSYLAVTSSTFQIGAHLELYMGAGSFYVDGWLGFDALIIFSPFSFEVDFTAGLALKSGNSTIMGITVDGTLTGPTPWHAEGDAHVSILFFSISVHVSLTIGDAQSNPLPQVNAWTPLQAAIASPANWSGALPAGAPSVATFAPPEGSAAPVLVDPAGTLTLREKVLPLNQAITKFGNAAPQGQSEFDLGTLTLGTLTNVPYATITDEFAPGQFADLSDSDKLSLPSFEPMVAGFTVSDAAVAFGKQYDVDIECDTIILDTPLVSRIGIRYGILQTTVLALANASAAAQGMLFTTGVRPSTPGPVAAPLVSLGAEQYVIAGVMDLVQRDIVTATTKTAAFIALARYLEANPDERDKLQVVPLHELAA